MEWEEIKKEAIKEIKEARNEADIENVRIKYLGRNGILSLKIKEIVNLSEEEKRNFGKVFNETKKFLEEEIIKRKESIQDKENKISFDITKPGKKIPIGHRHPLSQAEEEIKNIFRHLNFSVVYGPELETEYYNFDALNIPPNHPARDMWDTFWIEKAGKERLLLRTHTSPVQVRYMQKHKPPLRIIVPGRVFRYEAIDASHSINFYQVEGLMVGENVSLANFKFVVEVFFKKFFGRKIEFRYRPSYFPFTEPSLEVDIKLDDVWMEVMGAGMVSRYVFKAVGYDYDKIQGFAFGMGLDRLAMIKYKIPDIRLFYENDIRFLKQF